MFELVLFSIKDSLCQTVMLSALSKNRICSDDEMSIFVIMIYAFFRPHEMREKKLRSLGEKEKCGLILNVCSPS